MNPNPYPQPPQPQPAYPQPQPVQPQPVQPQPVYPQPQPVQPQPVYPQPQPVQPAYPQPQPGYPQPQPVYSPPAGQPLVSELFFSLMRRITEDTRKMFGFAHTIHIIAIIEIVLDCCSIVGLVLLAFPIAGKRIANSWNDSDISCVILVGVHSCLV